MTAPMVDHWVRDDAELAAVVVSDRLRLVLVRCGGCRFQAPAQDVAGIVAALEAAGDYVRDMSYPVEVLTDGRPPRPIEYPDPRRVPDPTARTSALAAGVPWCRVHGRQAAGPGFCCPDMERPRRAHPPAFRPEDCGGAFDGFSVTSDADPGL